MKQMLKKKDIFITSLTEVTEDREEFIKNFVNRSSYLYLTDMPHSRSVANSIAISYCTEYMPGIIGYLPKNLAIEITPILKKIQNIRVILIK